MASHFVNIESECLNSSITNELYKHMRKPFPYNNYLHLTQFLDTSVSIGFNLLYTIIKSYDVAYCYHIFEEKVRSFIKPIQSFLCGKIEKKIKNFILMFLK